MARARMPLSCATNYGAFFVQRWSVAARTEHRLENRRDGRRGARVGLLPALFPTSYFFHRGYRENFLALAIGAFVRAFAMGVAGPLGASRHDAPRHFRVPRCVEASAQYKKEGGRAREWLCSAAGAASALLPITLEARDAFEVLGSRRSSGQSLSGLGSEYARRGTLLGARAVEASVVEECVRIVGLVTVEWARMRASYAVWMSLNWLLWTSTKFVLSVPRYTLVMFPVFILLARATESRAVLRAAVTIWSLLLLALFVTRFVQGLWAF